MMADLAKIRHVVLDMDGTIYLGKKLFPQTRPFLDGLARMGIGHSFVTNNCSRSRAEYVHHLREIGIEADPIIDFDLGTRDDSLSVGRAAASEAIVRARNAGAERRFSPGGLRSR